MIRFGVVETDEEIVYENNQCKLKINQREFLRGKLLMTSSDICFQQNDSDYGFSIPWTKVTVQAITPDPQRCIYFMIDESWPGEVPANGPQNGNHADENVNEEEQNGSEDEGHDSEGSVQELTEFYIIPDTPGDVDEIYFVMTKFPENPAMDEDSDDDDFFDGENMEQMNINEDDERFADAE